jgi:superfamily II DNA or RNA helicase
VEAIRRAAPPGTWSLGVKLVRGGAAALESEGEEELVLRVRTPGRPVAPTVVLYPGEREWDCDCPGRVRPCEHIVAAALAMSQPAAAGGDAASGPARAAAAAAAWVRVAYRFTRDVGGLRLARALVRVAGDRVEETPLSTSLAALRARPEAAAELHLEEMDLRADQLLATGARGVLSPTKLEALLTVLVGARLVTLDGREVAVSDEVLRPRARVEDRGEELVVTVLRDPRITDVVSPGVALTADALHPLGETDLAGAYLQNLPFERVHPPTAAGELATKVLPELARRMTVDVGTRRVPPIVRDVPPRLVLTLEHRGADLSVLPTLVYGHPPSVRIDDGRMTYLGRGPVPLRDEPAERLLVERLRAELDLLPGRRATYSGPDAARFAERLGRWRGDLAGEAAPLVGRPAALRPVLEIAAPGGGAGAGERAPDVRFTLAFRVEGGAGGGGGGGGADAGTARTVSAEAVARAFREGLGLVPLDGGGWAALPQDFLAKHGDRLLDLLAARAGDGRIANHALPALAALAADLEHPAPPGLDRLAALAEGFEALPPAPLPGDLQATLRPYQRQAADWLAFLRSGGLGAILADDMGLGKTVEALAALAAPALVVCPTSVLPNWRAEIARFRPALSVSVYHGPARAIDPEAEVTLTTYALLRLDGPALAARRWATVVLDEAQAVKNPDSQVARAAYALDAGFRVALTGTPLENRLEELWSLAHFTNRGLLGGRREFDERYARPIASGDATATARLRERLRPFLLRRTKRAVVPELPPRTEALLRVALDDRERGVYDAVRAATRADVLALLAGGGNVLAALEALLRLRQAACHPALVPGQEAASSSKLDLLVEALATAAAEGHKALVFSQWTSLLDLVEPHLRTAGLTFARLDGSTRDRGAVVAEFQSPSGPPVMLLSLKAGGTGLNLTAADHVFLCDPWWNPAAEDQAADRAHRIGQDRPVMIYRLVATDTVEERILALQERKRALAEAAVGGGAAGGAALTRQDLLALLD